MAAKLVYFPVKGRAQSFRYLCADNNIPLEFQEVKLDGWQEIKPTTPFGQLPVVKVDGIDIAQSNAILRYFARKHGLYGSNEKEAVLIDMLNDQQEDLRSAYLTMIYKNYDAGKDEFVKSLPDKLKIFEKYLSSNKDGKGFFVGEKQSFVDYSIYDLLDNLLILCPTCLNEMPLLKEFHKRFASREGISKERSAEYFKLMPINGNGKQ